MTKKIFSMLFLCLFIFACAGAQTTPESAQSTASNAAVSSKEKKIKDEAQSPTIAAKKNQTSPSEATSIQYLFIIKDTKMTKEAKTKSKVIVILKKGEKVEKIDVSGNWYKVKSASGKTGWVLKKSVSENK